MLVELLFTTATILVLQVLVEDAEDGATYEFHCDRWLADDEDDNQIVRELECSKSTERKCQNNEKLSVFC